MITINLLHDTREARNRRRGRVTAGLLVATVTVITTSGAYLMRTRSAIRSEIAEAEIELADAAARAQRLELARRHHTELVQATTRVTQLLEDRASSSRLLETIGRGLPREVWLTSFKRSARSIEIHGRTSSISAASDFVQALAESVSFAQPPEIRSMSAEGAPSPWLMRFQIIGELKVYP